MTRKKIPQELEVSGNDRFLQHGYDDLYETGYNGKTSRPVVNRKAPDELDKGYAWVVCFASCLLYAATDGICFSLGILFPVFLETFKESVGFTSWISSTLFGSMLLSGKQDGNTAPSTTHVQTKEQWQATHLETFLLYRYNDIKNSSVLY